MGRWIAWLSALLRAGMAGTLVYLCGGDWPATVARMEFAALPDYNFVGEAEQLRQEERFAEALLVLDTGLAVDPAHQDALLALKRRTEEERDDVLRRLQAAGEGALSGTGDTVEGLTGAVVADLFVFGDVRDLVIQGSRYFSGEDADEVIVALSALGLALTLTPSLDAGVAILKFARKAGALTEKFAASLLRVARKAVDEKSADELVAVADDVATLGKQARPAGAIQILKHIDDPADLRVAAKFSERPGGAFALWLGGKPAVAMLKQADGPELLMLGARKGTAGIEMAARHGAVLLRPHPLLGLVKGVYKGNAPALAQELAAEHADFLLAVFGGWLAFELLLLTIRTRRLRPRYVILPASPP